MNFSSHSRQFVGSVLIIYAIIHNAIHTHTYVLMVSYDPICEWSFCSTFNFSVRLELVSNKNRKKYPVKDPMSILNYILWNGSLLHLNGSHANERSTNLFSVADANYCPQIIFFPLFAHKLHHQIAHIVNNK